MNIWDNTRKTRPILTSLYIDNIYLSMNVAGPTAMMLVSNKPEFNPLQTNFSVQNLFENYHTHLC